MRKLYSFESAWPAAPDKWEARPKTWRTHSGAARAADAWRDAMALEGAYPITRVVELIPDARGGRKAKESNNGD